MHQGAQPAVSRRRILALGASLAAALPVSIAVSGCSDSAVPDLVPGGGPDPTEVPPTPTPEPPFVVAAGEQERVLMSGTRFETPAYIFGSGNLGPIALALGGVHGNEPGGWLAAERAVRQLRPDTGALIVIPRANRVATEVFARTTDEIGDLNRAYPGDPNGTPSQQIAHQIVELIREFHVGLVVDMHESWAFYKDRPQNGTAFLGQTIGTNGAQASELSRAVVEAVNSRILYSHEEFFFRDRFGSNQAAAPGVPEGSSQADASGAPRGPGGASRSSLGLSTYVPGLVAILVEMGQQQTLERRTALHIEVLTEFLRRVGALAG
jgi:hypothetical protein